MRTALAAILCLLGLCACTRPGTLVIPNDAHSLEQYARGLNYKQEGRYLLALESFELARATARNDDMRARCDQEIVAARQAVKALR